MLPKQANRFSLALRDLPTCYRAIVLSKCNAGYFVQTSGSTTQTQCVVDISTHDGSNILQSSKSRSFVDQTGQSSQTACLIGTFNPNYGSVSSADCVNANPGHYVDQPGQASETPCTRHIQPQFWGFINLVLQQIQILVIS